MIETSGKNIILRTMTQKEMRALWRKFESDKGRKYVYNEAEVDRLYERSVECADRNAMVGIFTKNDEIVGALTFCNIVYSEKRCDISLFLANRSYRGKGYEVEAVMLAKRYAKEKMELKKMYADISSKDGILQRILKECGFQHTKTLRRGAPDGGDRMTFFAIL